MLPIYGLIAYLLPLILAILTFIKLSQRVRMIIIGFLILLYVVPMIFQGLFSYLVLYLSRIVFGIFCYFLLRWKRVPIR